MLIVTVRHPNSRQYDQFSERVRQRAIRDYGEDVYGDEVGLPLLLLISISVSASCMLAVMLILVLVLVLKDNNPCP